MTRPLPVLILCAALAVGAAGCGSGKKGSTAASSSTSSTSSGGPQSGVQVNGKINYAKPPANAPVKSGLVNISYHEISIEPDTLKVKVGSTLKWTNHDPVEHNVTAEPGSPTKFASKNFGENGTFQVKVTKPGVIHYKCTLHPATMNGTIEVVK
jgi:plastocyanin